MADGSVLNDTAPSSGPNEADSPDTGNPPADNGSDTEKRRRHSRGKSKIGESTTQLPRHSILPKVRRTNYEGFKNYFNEEDSQYAIEVLDAGYDIKDEVAREREKRGRSKQQTPTITSVPKEGITTDEVWIQRVRIQSDHILAHLCSIMGTTFKYNKPRTFFRPFHAFIHFQPRAKEALKDLREAVDRKRLDPGPSPKEDEEEEPLTEKDKSKKNRKETKGSSGNSDTGSVISPRIRSRRSSSTSSSGSSSGSSSRGSSSRSHSRSVYSSFSNDGLDQAIPEELLICEEAVDHLQCYIDFVDKNIMPLQDTYKGTSKQRIRYSDLTYLFHPGDVVYSPTEDEFTGSSNVRMAKLSPAVYQPIWKIQYTNPPSISDITPESYDPNHRFYISAFYVDFDGKNYGPVKYRFDIAPYEGEIEIKNLPVYPIRYHSGSHKSSSSHGLDRLRPAGKDFQYYVKEKHLYYRGWTLTTNPNGDTLTDGAGEPMKHPEHIDSSVIVDFQAALQALPSWKPTFKEPANMDQEWTSSTEDRLPIIQWTDSKRTKQVRRTIEATQMRDGAHAVETNTYAKRDPFLVAYMAGKTDATYELSEDDLRLLPGRVMAYVLRDRKFVQLDVHYLSKIEQQSNVFENLKISRQHKEMVMALVDSHFRKKAFRGPREFSLGQDLIQGKGEGLVILLHGVPGVGKTATAEAVAQSNQQPLFVITCGDLGFTPKEVERSLEEIFRLAHLWDCILLLDEADIFLGERRRDDLKRNALVSGKSLFLLFYFLFLYLRSSKHSHPEWLT